MNMKGICISSFGEPGDPKVWSGTTARIIDYFQQDKSFYTQTINLKDISGKLFKMGQIASRFMYRRGTLRDPFLYRIESKRIDKETYKHDVDVFLFVSEHAIGNRKNPNCRYYVYLDSLLRPYLEYDKRKLKPGSRWFLKHYEKNDKNCFRQYDGIMTLNQWSKDFLISEYGIDKDKIFNIGFGVNVSFYDGPKDYSNNQLMIVLREGTEYVKGLYLLLEAFEKVRREVRDAKLAVFGTRGKEMEGVTYYYNTPRDTMLEMYKKSTLYVMPNILEPNGITYLEALANKTPIVGLNRFSVPEFTGYGEYGFISKEATASDLCETILEALRDMDRLRIMGEKGQRFVRDRYCWDNVLSSMKSIILRDSQ